MSASTTSVTRFLEPFGRPSGLPLCPGANGRPRGFCAFISTRAGDGDSEAASSDPYGASSDAYETSGGCGAAAEAPVAECSVRSAAVAAEACAACSIASTEQMTRPLLTVLM